MNPPSEWAVQQATSVFELAPLGTTAEEFICRLATSLDAAKAEGAREMAVELAWLLNFVEEPEWFPNEGDMWWWRERMSRLRARAVPEPPR